MAASALKQNFFQQQLLQWFDRNGRKNLPWQLPRTPYRVWLSEIMLQQTQVATVIPYFQRFINHFPTIKSLALAEIDQVLTLWSGLGYYARARHLHQAAQLVMENFNGDLPNTLEELQSLPGIGRSTAGAILSLGFNQSAPILDGNVKRLFARLHAVEGSVYTHTTIKKLWSLAEIYCTQVRPCDYTQALMDFGSLVCIKKAPKCHQCPFKNGCIAFQSNQTQCYPQPRAAKQLRQQETIFLILVNTHREILLQKRPPTGIWGGLWSLPECQVSDNIEQWCQNHYGIKVGSVIEQPSFEHIFSHFRLKIRPLLISVDSLPLSLHDPGIQQWVSPQGIKEKGLAAPVRKVLNTIFKQS